MSEETAVAEVHEHHEGAHPSDWTYIKVAFVLAILTGIEITISYTKGLKGATANSLLLILAATKFSMVAMFFMHLKFDQPVLRKIFLAGLILATCVYIGYLLTLGAFS